MERANRDELVVAGFLNRTVGAPAMSKKWRVGCAPGTKWRVDCTPGMNWRVGCAPR